MYNAYDGKQRFYDEIGRRTREVKESLCDIKNTTNTTQGVLDSILQELQTLNSKELIYNTNEQFILTGTATVTLPANTYHSYSFVIFSGTVDITEGGTTFSNAGVGYYGDASATTFLSNSITFVGKESGTKVVIKTLK